jgi:Anti-sigma-K factor rskA/Putative zinc-finger
MSASNHGRYRDDVGAYLLDALTPLEREAFERHLAACGECQEELERLRPAAETLPGSVKQLEPPPGLKKRLMAEVGRDAAAAQADRRVRRPGPIRGALERLRGLGVPRAAVVAATVLLGLAIAFGVAQLSGGDGTRTVTATVANLAPRAGGTLEVEGDDATLRLHDMPDLGRSRVYQVWYQHGDRLVPARTFEIGASGRGDVPLRRVADAQGVFVTREARGGAEVPSENPIVSVPL